MIVAMPRDGAIIFGDLIGKLDVLRVLDEITADCPKKSAQNWNDQCAMARPCGLSPSRSSGIRIHAKAVNAADTRMSGASRLLNTC